MILGIDEIHKLVDEMKLLENLSERELKNPEGAGIDLRIGELYELSGAGFLGVKDRKTPKAKLVACYDPKKKIKATLKPKCYYTMTTVEEVNTPENLVILFRPRSTLYRSGVTLFTGNCAPGYCGKLTFGLINFGTKPFVLEMGARVAHALFFEVKGSTNLYRGQWQGGRVDTGGIEKQI